ncbi:transglutaminase family protein [Roseovarius sp. CAU 1744]|uniref:transglutaminase family protein n=1 Tax=Roseovarius sp. CAU 1744 TaxID=3140368 RepID=UPI00325A4C8D
MRLKIEHKTLYKFDEPVSFGLQKLRKTPKSSPQQTVVTWHTQVKCGRKELEYEDHHHNRVELLSFEPQATELEVSCSGEVDMVDTSGVVGPHRGPSPLWLYQQQTDLTRAKTGVRALLRDNAITPDLDGMHRLTQAIREAVAYKVGVSEMSWSAEDVVEAGKGVCQDHSHVFLACARHLDVPARYVSGYLMLNDKTAQEAMHAWVEAHIGDLGWVGFDVSNGISPDTRYVRVATGLDYTDASPVTGVRVGGKGEHLDVRIDVSQQ